MEYDYKLVNPFQITIIKYTNFSNNCRASISYIFYKDLI